MVATKPPNFNLSLLGKNQISRRRDTYSMVQYMYLKLQESTEETYLDRIQILKFYGIVYVPKIARVENINESVGQNKLQSHPSR